MRARLLLVSASTALALSFVAPALAADTAEEFVDKAAIGGMFEVESSKVAVTKAGDQSVKDFAQKMIDDHGAANAKLAAIAADQNLQIPATLDAKHKSDLDTLNNEGGPIDAAYVEMQSDAHDEAVELFESYARDGDNAQLKSFAEATLPTLKMHQEMVEKISSQMDGGGLTSSTSETPAVNTAGETNPAAPVPGANSFTEDQAKDRIQEAGFSDVTGLVKDDQGIWRGKAMKDGKSTAVALDFQGNVVAGAN